jgi:hypothetical protein
MTDTNELVVTSPSPKNLAEIIINNGKSTKTVHSSEAVSATSETPPQKEEPTEVAAAPVVEPEKEAPALSDAWAKIAAKEAEIAAKQKEIELRDKDLEGKLTSVKEYEDALSNAKTAPLEALKKLGVSYEELTQFLLNDQKPTPELKIKSLEDQIVALTNKINKQEEEQKQKVTKAEQDSFNESINAYKADLKKAVDAKADDYELIIANKAYDLVFEVQKVHFEETKGKELSLEDAAKQVEEYLFKQAQSLLKLKKLQPKPVEPETQKQQSVTLTDSTMTAPVSEAPRRAMSRDQRLKEAAKLIRWD